jgi:glycerol-3-phosphate acyltransferase PlsY
VILSTIIALFAGYLCGSIPFGFLAGKLKGIDVRDHGSGNIGTTNVFRTLGRRFGIPVLILDVLKGVVPVLLAGWYFRSDGHPPGEVDLLQISTAIATILGHNFTCWLRFKGGKGIATSAGALAAVIPWAVLFAVIIWIILFLATRYVSVASMAAAVTLPLAVLAEWGTTGKLSAEHLVFSIVVCLLAIWRHKGNIQKLRAGTENRFQRKEK